jgi:alpha-ribazole phosphatase
MSHIDGNDALPPAASRHATSKHAASKHAALKHVFLRHPPIPQAKGVCYGRTDYALPAAVHADCAARLHRAHPELAALPIVCSPALRCRDLALALALHGDTERALHSDLRLLEMDFGDWEGQRWSALPRALLDAWAADVPGFAPPGGESFGMLIDRVNAALAALRTPHLIVAHAGVIRAAAHLLGGLPREIAAQREVAYLEPVSFAADSAQTT